MKNYQAQTRQNLALTKILQKFQENEHTPGVKRMRCQFQRAGAGYGRQPIIWPNKNEEIGYVKAEVRCERILTGIVFAFAFFCLKSMNKAYKRNMEKLDFRFKVQFFYCCIVMHIRRNLVSRHLDCQILIDHFH